MAGETGLEPGWVRKALAEFLGAMALIVFGAGSVVATTGPRFDAGTALLIRSLAHGLVIAVMASAIAPISGGQISPAVTVGLLVARKIRASTAVVVIVAQLLGSILGALILLGMFPPSQVTDSRLGTPGLAVGMSEGTGAFVELVLTFFLAFVVLATAVDPRGAAKQFSALAIGLTVAIDWLLGGTLTGAAMSPGRWLGPAIVSGILDHAWVYWVGPLLGGGLGGYLYAAAFLPREKPTP